LLHGPNAIFALVKPLQFRSTGSIPNHFVSVMSKLTHYLHQFPFSANCGVHIDASEEDSKAFVSAMLYFLIQAPQPIY
jgi:hypothetical protein